VDKQGFIGKRLVDMYQHTTTIDKKPIYLLIGM